MSTSVSRRSSATVHPTRQQLDELDALLKRMLDLPVNRLEDEARTTSRPAPRRPAATVASRVAAPEPMRGRIVPTVARQPAEPPAVNTARRTRKKPTSSRAWCPTDAPAPRDSGSAAEPGRKRRSTPQDWVPLSSTWQPSARTWKPLSEAWKQAQTAAGRPADAPSCRGEPALAAEPPPEPRAETDTPASRNRAESAPAEPPHPRRRPRRRASAPDPCAAAALAAVAAARLQRGLRRLPGSLRSRRPLAARADRPDGPRRRRPAGPGRRPRPGRWPTGSVGPLDPLR